MPDAARIGAWLKVQRERHGQLSQEQAAARVESTARTVGAWERGETAPPADKFLALVQLYNAEGRVTELLEPTLPPDARQIATGRPVSQKKERRAR